MSGKCKEVCIQILHIDWHMRGALCPVHHDNGIFFMCHGCDLFDRVHTSEHVRNLCDCYDFCLFRNLFFYLIKIHRSVRTAFDKPEYRSCLPRNHLPWQKIAVMFHDRNEDFIPGIYIV